MLSRACLATGRRAKIRREGDDLMSMLDQAARDVVIANRILAHEGVVDAYGHVSVRHPLDPTRYLLSRSRAPELVERGDIVEFDLEGKSVVFFQAEDGIRDHCVTGVQTCALPI